MIKYLIGAEKLHFFKKALFYKCILYCTCLFLLTLHLVYSFFLVQCLQISITIYLIVLSQGNCLEGCADLQSAHLHVSTHRGNSNRKLGRGTE